MRLPKPDNLMGLVAALAQHLTQADAAIADAAAADATATVGVAVAGTSTVDANADDAAAADATATDTDDAAAADAVAEGEGKQCPKCKAVCPALEEYCPVPHCHTSVQRLGDRARTAPAAAADHGDCESDDLVSEDESDDDESASRRTTTRETRVTRRSQMMCWRVTGSDVRQMMSGMTMSPMAVKISIVCLLRGRPGSKKCADSRTSAQRDA